MDRRRRRRGLRMQPPASPARAGHACVPAPPSRARAAIAYPRSVAGNSAIPGVLAWQARARLSRSEQPLTQADSAGNLSLEGSLAGLGRGRRGNHGFRFMPPGPELRVRPWDRLGWGAHLPDCTSRSPTAATDLEEGSSDSDVSRCTYQVQVQASSS